MKLPELVDLVVMPDDRPGELARLSAALGHAGLNIQGLSAFTGGGTSVVHLLVDAPEVARAALSDHAGLEVRAQRHAVIVNVPDRPLVLAAIAQRLADAGINIEQAYTALGTRTASRLVLVTDDSVRSERLLHGVTP